MKLGDRGGGGNENGLCPHHWYPAGTWTRILTRTPGRDFKVSRKNKHNQTNKQKTAINNKKKKEKEKRP